MLFKLVELYLWRIERCIWGKQVWCWQLKSHFDVCRPIWRPSGWQVSRKTVAKFLASTCDSPRIIHDDNQLRFSNSKHFVSEWYFPKNREIGSLVVRQGKKIVRLTAESWAWTTCGPASSLSRGRVKKLQKSKKFCLKLAMVLIWNIQSPHEDNLSSCERYKIILTSKALGTRDAHHFLIAEQELSICDSWYLICGAD